MWQGMWEASLRLALVEVADVSFERVAAAALGGIRGDREVPDLAAFVWAGRVVALADNPYVSFSSINLTPGFDSVAADLADVTRVLHAITRDWSNPASLNRRSGAAFTAALQRIVAERRAEGRVAGDDTDGQDIDVLLVGVVVSLWLAEQFAADLKTLFLGLRVAAISANKVIGVLGGNRGRVPATGFPFCRSSAKLAAAIALAISHSGQTIPTIHAVRLLNAMMPGRVFAMVSGGGSRERGRHAGAAVARRAGGIVASSAAAAAAAASCSAGFLCPVPPPAPPPKYPHCCHPPSCRPHLSPATPPPCAPPRRAPPSTRRWRWCWASGCPPTPPSQALLRHQGGVALGGARQHLGGGPGPLPHRAAAAHGGHAGWGHRRGQGQGQAARWAGPQCRGASGPAGGAECVCDGEVGCTGVPVAGPGARGGGGSWWEELEWAGGEISWLQGGGRRQLGNGALLQVFCCRGAAMRQWAGAAASHAASALTRASLPSTSGVAARRSALTGFDAAGGPVDSPHHGSLVQAGRRWALHILEGPWSWALAAAYIAGTVISGYPVGGRRRWLALSKGGSSSGSGWLAGLAGWLAGSSWQQRLPSSAGSSIAVGRSAAGRRCRPPARAAAASCRCAAAGGARDRRRHHRRSGCGP